MHQRRRCRTTNYLSEVHQTYEGKSIKSKNDRRQFPLSRSATGNSGPFAEFHFILPVKKASTKVLTLNLFAPFGSRCCLRFVNAHIVNHTQARERMHVYSQALARKYTYIRLLNTLTLARKYTNTHTYTAVACHTNLQPSTRILMIKTNTSTNKQTKRRAKAQTDKRMLERTFFISC